VHERDSHVCRLKKALYGLKLAPRAWYLRIDGYLLGMGFTKSEVYPLILVPIVIHCDNQSCIKLLENPVFHDRSKHVEIKYHFT
jgi:hypothetical protein